MRRCSPSRSIARFSMAGPPAVSGHAPAAEAAKPYAKSRNPAPHPAGTAAGTRLRENTQGGSQGVRLPRTMGTRMETRFMLARLRILAAALFALLLAAPASAQPS